MLRGMTRNDRVGPLDRWERSGLSAAAFAPFVGPSPWTLHAWRRLSFLDSSRGRHLPKSDVTDAIECLLK
jgi:hypothetical protein